MDHLDVSRSTPLHVLMVSYHGHGHVNPLLRLANCLAAKGLFISFSTTANFLSDFQKAYSHITHDEPIPVGPGFIRFEFFQDGWDWETKSREFEPYHQHLETVGKEKVTEMVKRYEEQGRPVSCIINNPFVPWVSEVARSLGIANSVLWVQSCACFAAYYHYQHNTVAFPSENEPELDVQLPCMPLLKYDEVPSFLHPSSPYAPFSRPLLQQIHLLNKSSWVLMDTFQELEHQLIDYMSKFCSIKPIGPLFKIAASVATKISSSDVLKPEDDDCMEWLNSRAPSSVVYISFGTVAYLKQEQIDEIAHSLLNSRVSFLWVMKPPLLGLGLEPYGLPDGFLEEVGDRGKILKWCPQEKVLSHQSIACFLTHCGWNSTIEALTNGVPLLAFPQWGDQVTNSKYLVDVFGVGIRLSRGAAEDKIVGRKEIEKGLHEATEGPKAVEIKENAFKWRNKAEQAFTDGGSSSNNMQTFVDHLLHVAGRD